MNLIKYPGGKSYLMKWHISLFPHNWEYCDFIDPFGGGLNAILKTSPSTGKKEVVGEIDNNVYSLYLAVKYYNQDLFDLVNVGYQERTFKLWKEKEPKTVVDIAAREFIIRNMSRGGHGEDFAWSERLRGGQPGDVNAYINKVRGLKKIGQRLKKVELFLGDACSLIKNRAHKQSLVYLDPPYIHSTRVTKKLYRHEMTNAQHKQLLEVVLANPACYFICNYDNPLYNEMLAGWKKHTKNVVSNAGQTKTKKRKEEVVWTNF